MALLEILMRPLLNAQRAAGREEGTAAATAAANAEFEAWKERQRAAGVRFIDDEPREHQPNAEP